MKEANWYFFWHPTFTIDKFSDAVDRHLGVNGLSFCKCSEDMAFMPLLVTYTKTILNHLNAGQNVGARQINVLWTIGMNCTLQNNTKIDTKIQNN